MDSLAKTLKYLQGKWDSDLPTIQKKRSSRKGRKKFALQKEANP